MKKKDILISIAIIAAAALTLWLYLQQKGRVRIDAGNATAVLRLRNGWLGEATIASGVEPAAIRAQVHRPQHLSISKEQDGHTWQIDSRGPWGHLSKIKVKNNQTTALQLGPPFSIKPRVSRSGPVLSIDYAIIGRAGELYQSFATKDGQAVTSATINIVDEAGNVLNSGKFSFG
jgi:hypothetical protein